MGNFMQLLDIIELVIGGENIRRSPIFINSGGLGLTPEQKKDLVKLAMESQHRGEATRSVRIGSFSGVISSQGSCAHFSLGRKGERYKVFLQNGRKSGEFDFMLTLPSYMSCGVFDNKPKKPDVSIPRPLTRAEEQHQDYVNEVYGGYEPVN